MTHSQYLVRWNRLQLQLQTGEKRQGTFWTNQQSSNTKGYDDTAARMFELAQTMPGFLGVESTRDESGLGRAVQAIKVAKDTIEFEL